MNADFDSTADAVLEVDDAGAVTLFIGQGTEPRAEATTNSVVIRILLDHAADLDRPVTVATHYPSGHHTLHQFEPDGAVTTVEAAIAHRARPGTSTESGADAATPAATPTGTDEPPTGPTAPESGRRSRPGTIIGASVLLITALTLTGADSPPPLLADAAPDGQAFGSDTLTDDLGVFRAYTDPAPPDGERHEPTHPLSRAATGNLGPSSSFAASPAGPYAGTQPSVLTNSPRVHPGADTSGHPDGYLSDQPNNEHPSGHPDGETSDQPDDDPDQDPQPPPEQDADPEPPTRPSGLSVTGRSGTSLTAAWSPSTADLGVAGYAVYVDGARVDTVSATGVTVSGLSSAVSYVISVAAIDTAGTTGPRASVTATTLDTKSPSVPSSLALTGRTGTSLSVSWNPSTDNVSVTSYAIYVNGKRSLTVGGTSASVGGLNPGRSYQISVAALDAAGNRSGTTSVRGTTLDTVAPDAPTGLSGRAGLLSVDLSWDDAVDNVGVVSYAIYVDGNRTETITSTSTTINGLLGGVLHTFSVAAIDGAGNESPRVNVKLRAKLL